VRDVEDALLIVIPENHGAVAVRIWRRHIEAVEIPLVTAKWSQAWRQGVVLRVFKK
jgi:hypothetical protein